METPVPASRPRVDVDEVAEANKTIFSPGIHTPGHDIESIFKNIANTPKPSSLATDKAGSSADGKADEAADMTANSTEQEQSPIAVEKPRPWCFGWSKAK